MTSTGRVMGSPAYMSPDAIMSAGVDQRSDLYSLGVVLFRVLSARLPYTAANRMMIMAMHVNEPVPDPVIDDSTPLGAPMAAFVKRLLAKKSADRYQTAEEALQHLMQIAGRSLADPIHLKNAV